MDLRAENSFIPALLNSQNHLYPLELNRLLNGTAASMSKYRLD